MLRKLFLSAVISASALASTPASASVLDTVLSRGTLNCGTDNTAPGFGYLNTRTGKLEGLDVDLCRAVASAVLGDPAKVNFVIVTDKSRFNALQTNQVDVVFAHTTMTSTREASIGIDFLPITFYDGTGVLVKTESGVKSFSEMEGSALCTTQGSSTEPTIAAQIKGRGWKNTQVLTYENLEKLFGALNSGRCNAMITDKSALAAWRGNSSKPGDFTILPETLDKSPFAGFVIPNDSKWRNTLRWAIYALFQAEEAGITSSNLDEAMRTTNPAQQKLLGVLPGIGKPFGLPDTFVVSLIKGVGNYGEIYERNLGPKTPYYIDRKGTPNAGYKDGGALYSPVWK